MKTSQSDLSSFLAIKGPLIEETYRAAREWDLSLSRAENYSKILDSNSIGATSTSWLKNIIKVLQIRYDFAEKDRPLVQMAQSGWHLEDWRPVMLWHIAGTDELLRSFLVDWLFQRREEGMVLITTDSVRRFLEELTKERLGSSTAWKESTLSRVASGLLKAAVDFGLMRGKTSRAFESYRLPEQSLLYLLHVLMEREQNTRNLVHAPDWRLFLLKPEQVEEELLRLHQFGKLRFERAGSFLELTLPCEHADDFIRSLT